MMKTTIALVVGIASRCKKKKKKKAVVSQAK